MIQTAVILAAGLGSRLKHHTTDMPKGFLEIGGQTLIDRSMGCLKDHGIRRFIIGTGYLSHFYDRLASTGSEVVTRKNPIFDRTSSFYTLANLVDLIHEDFLLLESDLLYEPRALAHLCAINGEDVILASGRTDSGDEVYIETDDRGNLVHMSKDRGQLQSVAGELVGISRITADTVHRVVDLIRSTPSEMEKIDYETALTRYSAIKPIRVDVIPDLIWTEIDTEDHLNRANTQIYPKIIQSNNESIKEDLMQPPVKRNILLNPGPATTTDKVKYAQVVPDICPREKEFCNVMETVAKDLVRVVNGDDGHEAVMFTASGTGGVEAMISSIIPEGGKLLVVINGAYGDRMQKMAEIYYSVDRAVPYRIPYGDYPNVGAMEEMIRADRAISHIAVVHHETTTGMLNPVREIARMAHGHGVEMIVDAVSSYAGIPIHIDDDGFDYLVSTSNKNIQGMAGIAFVIARRENIEKLKDIPKRNLYLNLYDQYLSQKKSGQMRFTPAVQVIYALKQALVEFFEETPEGRYTRYRTSWKILVAGLERLGFRFLLPRDRQAGLITSVYEPDHPGFDFNAMHDHLYRLGYTIYPGKVADTPTFRVANIGAIDERDIRGFLDELGRYLDANRIVLTSS